MPCNRAVGPSSPLAIVEQLLDGSELVDHAAVEPIRPIGGGTCQQRRSAIAWSNDARQTRKPGIARRLEPEPAVDEAVNTRPVAHDLQRRELVALPHPL